MSIIVATQGSGFAGVGLGLPRTSLRKQRRQTRQDAGRRGWQRLGGFLTGGVSNALMARRVRNRAEENIQRRATMQAPLTPTQDIALQASVTNGAPPPAGEVLDAALASGTDLNSALRASGITPDPDTASDVIVDLRSGATGGTLVDEMLAQYPTAQVNECDCLVTKLAVAQGLELTDAMWQSGMTGCIENRAAFRAQVSAAGQGTEGCRPWYMKKAVWIVGGSAVAAAIILKKRR